MSTKESHTTQAEPDLNVNRIVNFYTQLQQKNETSFSQLKGDSQSQKAS